MAQFTFRMKPIAFIWYQFTIYFLTLSTFIFIYDTDVNGVLFKMNIGYKAFLISHETQIPF